MGPDSALPNVLLRNLRKHVRFWSHLMLELWIRHCEAVLFVCKSRIVIPGLWEPVRLLSVFERGWKLSSPPPGIRAALQEGLWPRLPLLPLQPLARWLPPSPLKTLSVLHSFCPASPPRLSQGFTPVDLLLCSPWHLCPAWHWWYRDRSMCSPAPELILQEVEWSWQLPPKSKFPGWKCDPECLEYWWCVFAKLLFFQVLWPRQRSLDSHQSDPFLCTRVVSCLSGSVYPRDVTWW